MRETQLDLPKRVGLTKEAHNMLRELRKRKKESMAKIVIDLINKEFKNDNT